MYNRFSFVLTQPHIPTHSALDLACFFCPRKSVPLPFFPPRPAPPSRPAPQGVYNRFSDAEKQVFEQAYSAAFGPAMDICYEIYEVGTWEKNCFILKLMVKVVVHALGHGHLPFGVRGRANLLLWLAALCAAHLSLFRQACSPQPGVEHPPSATSAQH